MSPLTFFLWWAGASVLAALFVARVIYVRDHRSEMIAARQARDIVKATDLDAELRVLIRFEQGDLS